ncbi:MAG: MBL fold metallo-hydrolase [bacterium]|nr:MBL fold metallo-hydrolase [bacterium]
MKLGKFEIYSAWDGYFKLDCGAMFGVVPKPMWSRTDPPDDRNRILMSMNPLVIKTGKEIFLVDTGIGDKFPEKQIDFLGLDRNVNLNNSLAEMGIRREDITGVILTHLHFDHAGGNTFINGKGELEPAYPNAVYYIQQGEWNLAMSAGPRTKASYLEENYVPLRDNKQVHFLRGDSEIIRGIHVEVTGGHTEHHQVVYIESDDKKAIYFGDIIPTSSHVRIPYVMGYDTHPLTTVEVKQRLVPQAVKENWLVIFPHSPRMKAGYLEDDERGFKLNTVDMNEE